METIKGGLLFPKAMIRWILITSAIFFCFNGNSADLAQGKSFTNSLGIIMIKLNCATNQKSAPSDVWLSKYEVRQSEWLKIMKKNPSYSQGADLPVEGITYSNAVEFCKKLSKVENRFYRLPTTNEWLCAAVSATAVGESMLIVNTNTNTIPVGQTTSNPLGFCGMNDNVIEWCSDVWDPDLVVDGLRVSGGRAVAGSSFLDAYKLAEFDRGFSEDYRANFLGMRLVLESKPVADR